MKKLKKTVSILLCLLMAAAALAMPAAEATDDLARKNDLVNMMEDLIELTWSKYPMTGNHDETVYSGDSMSKLVEQYKIANETISGDVDWTVMPLEELEQMYTGFLAAYEGLKVYRRPLQDLYDRVKDEENECDYYSARYYPETMWRGFCAARQTAKDVLAAENPSDDAITGAYFALRSAFNELCKSNQVLGDINQNGKIDVGDILYLQKYLAGIVKLNSSQKFVASVTDFAVGKVSMDDVLNIQKFLANFKEELAGFDLSKLIYRDRNSLIDTGWII